MHKKLFTCAVMAMMILALGTSIAHAGDSWTGEIIEKACYEKDHTNVGAGHAGCAKGCFGRGAEVGLLTEDGSVIVLRANPDDDTPFEALKELAGMMAQVEGTMVEEDGVHIVTVTSMEAVN